MRSRLTVIPRDFNPAATVAHHSHPSVGCRAVRNVSDETERRAQTCRRRSGHAARHHGLNSIHPHEHAELPLRAEIDDDAGTVAFDVADGEPEFRGGDAQL